MQIRGAGQPTILTSHIRTAELIVERAQRAAVFEETLRTRQLMPALCRGQLIAIEISRRVMCLKGRCRKSYRPTQADGSGCLAFAISWRLAAFSFTGPPTYVDE